MANNTTMKYIKIILALFLFSSVHAQDESGYTGMKSYLVLRGIKADSGLHVPGYSGVPFQRVGVSPASGNIGIDTVADKLYFWSGAAWHEAGGGGGGGLTVTNEADNRVITSTGAGTGNAEANLTFDGNTLKVTGTTFGNGDLAAENSHAVGATLRLNATAAGGRDLWWISLGSSQGSTPAGYMALFDAATGAFPFAFRGSELSTMLVEGTNAYATGIRVKSVAAGGSEWHLFSGANGSPMAGSFSIYGGTSPDHVIWWNANKETIVGGTTDNGAYKLQSNGASYLKSGVVGAGSGVAGIGGSLKSIYTDVGNVGAGEDDLHSFTIPAGTLATNGDFIEFEMTFVVANSTEIHIYFGATDIGSALGIFAAGTYTFKGTIIRTGDESQRISVTSGTGGTAIYTTAAETLSGTVVLKATGEATTTNDIIQKMSIVKYMPAN